jgi:hypothetical protein
VAILRRPPPVRPPRPQFHYLPNGTRLVRLFNPKPHGIGALTFRTFGPLDRFDHQLRKDGKPCDNPERGIYYAGLTLSCCIAETFGDIGVIETGEMRVASPITTRPLKLLDLRGQGAMRAGTVSGIASVPSRRLSQRWSVYFYDNAVYGDVDGLIYPNVYSGEEYLALYERAQDALHCEETDIMRLGSPALRAYLLDLADRFNLECP